MKWQDKAGFTSYLNDDKGQRRVEVWASVYRNGFWNVALIEYGYGNVQSFETKEEAIRHAEALYVLEGY